MIKTWANNLLGLKVLPVLLVFFCLLQAKSQVNSPDLRCLKVINNGDVVLNWQIPPDPNNQFSYYVIYSSLLKNAAFSPVDSISNYSTATYTHVGAGAGIQSRYYYILTKYNQGGLQVSTHKDTLRSIWLGLISISGAKTLKLQYNELKTPRLLSSGSFTIAKEYPAGSWNTLRIVNSDNYGDTISICTASLNYKISMSDNSGCISESNISGGLYNDTKSPEEPVVDSISVLPNGQTVIAWQVPIDKDIVKYEIQLLTPAGTNTVIDEVIGRNNTVYTYTNTAATLTNTAIFVAAIDSCKRGSTLNYSLSTIFLKTMYSSCDFKTQLSWNPYISMATGVKEYQVFYAINNGPFTKIATTTLTAFTHTGVSAGSNVTYLVRAVNNAKTITSSSNRANFVAYLVKTPSYLYMPTASVVDKTSVQVKILIDTSKDSNGIDLLRSEDGITYSHLAFISYGGSPNLLYLDNSTETLNKNYLYKAVLRDSCGNSRIESNVCKTILLQVNEDQGNFYKKHLSWTAYQGFAGGIKYYRVYRVINDIPDLNAIATTSNNVTKYDDNIESLSNEGAKIYYYVEAVENNTGNPYGITEISRSNPADVYMDDNIYIPSAFAPNGSNQKWLPITNFIDKSDYLLRVFDRWGRQVFQTNNDAEAWDGSNLPGDVYAYLISYKNARGEYKEAKGTVLLMK